jgi:signal recognition particle receptor subunit beta
MQIDFAKRRIGLKLVVWGPWHSGRTSFLEQLQRRPGPFEAGEVEQTTTDTDRSSWLDLHLPGVSMGGMSIRVRVQKVDGSGPYPATKRLVAQGADGVVFVADSREEQRDANRDELELLREIHQDGRFGPEGVPMAERVVFVWNRRDAPTALSVSALEALFNPGGQPGFEAILAPYGVGVLPALEELVARVLAGLVTHGKMAVEGWPRIPAPPPIPDPDRSAAPRESSPPGPPAPPSPDASAAPAEDAAEGAAHQRGLWGRIASWFGG